MKNVALVGAAICIAASFCAQTSAATTRSIGQTLVYDVTHVSKSLSGPPAGLPAEGQAMYAAAMAKAAKGITSTFTFVVDRVDADGNAHVNGTIAAAQFPAAALAIAPYLNTLQGTLAADGRIVPAYDASLPNETTRDNKYHEIMPTPQSAQNLNARLFPDTEFNRFALGCGKRGRFKTGDTWRVNVRDATSGFVYAYDFAVTGTELNAGRQTAVVTMTSNHQGQYGSQKIDATGHYDPVGRLVTGFHEETTYDQTTPGGHQAGSDTYDFTLHQ